MSTLEAEWFYETQIADEIDKSGGVLIDGQDYLFLTGQSDTPGSGCEHIPTIEDVAPSKD